MEDPCDNQWGDTSAGIGAAESPIRPELLPSPPQGLLMLFHPKQIYSQFVDGQGVITYIKHNWTLKGMFRLVPSNLRRWNASKQKKDKHPKKRDALLRI